MFPLPFTPVIIACPGPFTRSTLASLVHLSINLLERLASLSSLIDLPLKRSASYNKFKHKHKNDAIPLRCKSISDVNDGSNQVCKFYLYGSSEAKYSNLIPTKMMQKKKKQLEWYFTTDARSQFSKKRNLSLGLLYASGTMKFWLRPGMIWATTIDMDIDMVLYPARHSNGHRNKRLMRLCSRKQTVSASLVILRTDSWREDIIYKVPNYQIVMAVVWNASGCQM